MKLLIQQYGGMILAVAIALLLFQCVNSLEVSKKAVESLWKDIYAPISGDSFHEIKNQIKRRIQPKEPLYLVKNQWIQMSEIWDMDSVIEMKVIKVYNEDWAEKKVLISTERDSLCIEDVGAYWILFEVNGEEMNSSQMLGKIYVNER